MAVGAIVVQDGKLLMVRRGRAPGEGLWSLPGGRVEQGEHLAAALVREVKEETGLDVDVTGTAGIFEVVGEHHFVVIDYFARVTRAAEPVPGSDAAEVRWVDLGAVAGLECTPNLLETLRGWRVLPAEV